MVPSKFVYDGSNYENNSFVSYISEKRFIQKSGRGGGGGGVRMNCLYISNG